METAPIGGVTVIVVLRKQWIHARSRELLFLSMGPFEFEPFSVVFVPFGSSPFSPLFDGNYTSNEE